MLLFCLTVLLLYKLNLIDCNAHTSAERQKSVNRPFARSGHMVQNHTCWLASCTVGLPKQRQVKVDWYEIVCCGSPTVQLAHQHE